MSNSNIIVLLSSVKLLYRAPGGPPPSGVLVPHGMPHNERPGTHGDFLKHIQLQTGVLQTLLEEEEGVLTEEINRDNQKLAQLERLGRQKTVNSLGAGHCSRNYQGSIHRTCTMIPKVL